jgi:hypothetical protein
MSSCLSANTFQSGAATSAAASATGVSESVIAQPDPAAAAAAGPPSRFPAFFNLIYVSATPIDTLAYNISIKQPVRVVMLDREIMAGNGYVGPEDLHLFRDANGDEVSAAV